MNKKLWWFTGAGLFAVSITYFLVNAPTGTMSMMASGTFGKIIESQPELTWMLGLPLVGIIVAVGIIWKMGGEQR